MISTTVIFHRSALQRIEVRKAGRGYVAEYYNLNAWTARNTPGAVPVIIKTETIKGGMPAVKREAKRAADLGFKVEWI